MKNVILDIDGVTCKRKTNNGKRAYELFYSKNPTKSALAEEFKNKKYLPDIEKHPLIKGVHHIENYGNGLHFIATTLPQYVVQMSNTDRFYSCFRPGRSHDSNLIKELLDPNLILFMVAKIDGDVVKPTIRTSSRVMYEIPRRSFRYDLAGNRLLEKNKIIFINRLYLGRNVSSKYEFRFIERVNKFCKDELKISTRNYHYFANKLISKGFFNPYGKVYSDLCDVYSNYVNIGKKGRRINFYVHI